MSALTWDETGKHFHEKGIDKAVLYPKVSRAYPTGVSWNGLFSVSESPSGAEPTPIYADNIKYLNLLSVEELGLTIEAYTYPDEFKRCLGKHALAQGVFIGQQRRLSFGLCYRTLIGNDTDSQEQGYKLHLVYDCFAFPSEDSYNTINDSPEIPAFSWEISSNSMEVNGYKPTSTLTFDSTKFKSEGLVNVLRGIEEVLYGSTGATARLPLISEIGELFQFYAHLSDSSNGFILDSSGNMIQSAVYD